MFFSLTIITVIWPYPLSLCFSPLLVCHFASVLKRDLFFVSTFALLCSRVETGQFISVGASAPLKPFCLQSVQVFMEHVAKERCGCVALIRPGVHLLFICLDFY